ncbi:hypothetical protein B0H12DRAFT_1188514 [Mycena haematopus]|nr:hypothetical protein B0H12DRAFT_1188514 [Mycena haematopus]
MEWYPWRRYLNAEKRDVHVWASENSVNGNRYLVAGCWTNGGRITAQVFYDWLGEILLNRSNGNYVLVFIGPRTPSVGVETEYMSSQAFQQYVNVSVTNRAYVQAGPQVLQAGDYLLFRLSAQGQLRRVVPDLRETPITSRTVTRPTGTGTKKNPHKRSQLVRNDVRARDLCCRATGILVLGRRRGQNFKGMQVAHIYPLGYWNMANRLLSSQVRHHLAAVKGDHAENALLMRSDAHDQFDDYQFGFWQRNNAGPGPAFYRFERSGAPSIPVLSNSPMGVPLGTTATPNFRSELLKSHFVTCLLWHVCGFGRDMNK